MRGGFCDTASRQTPLVARESLGSSNSADLLPPALRPLRRRLGANGSLVLPIRSAIEYEGIVDASPDGNGGKGR